MSMPVVVTLDFERGRCQPFGRETRPWRHVARPAIGAELSAYTDLSFVRGKRVLCIFDDDNLRIGMAELGLHLSYTELLRRLAQDARGVTPRVVLTAPPGDRRREALLRTAGWQPLWIPHEIVQTWKGSVKKANADLDIAFEAASIARIEEPDVALIGTGDGDLATAIARGFRRVGIAEVSTLSVPRSSSSRLHDPELFANNALIGMDLTGRNEH